ncbi:Nucleoporin, Nup133/Nup155-like protein [Arabidopsis thaliana]|uniref:Isoform 2 of Nuclear pore complex protein NUP133 n=1 Tax=Arabidopsis thaliana TaxID=3702 RepID=F4IGA5-2|nr:Nucleoporin, Nup133/Nup155-like protein [Arabidopsis thaliana]AEC05897.1 Nucleoporin, Nup133/Nup155-like protein [Arabidopsis thaliana]|eukprot:NP_001189511.1 Nucleoporin, Nup133/Nup155-like protein [Arabidopsis thaliana]
MFSPLTKRAKQSSRNEKTPRNRVPPPDSPVTPATQNRNNFISDRPATGTPAPWAPRLSVLARVSPGNNGDKGVDSDQLKPVFVGEFPQLLRDEQSYPGDACVSGGMDKETCLSWFITGSKVFVWSHLTTLPSRKCVVLELPVVVLVNEESGSGLQDGKSWLVNVVSWDTSAGAATRASRSRSPVGVVMCNRKTRAVAEKARHLIKRQSNGIRSSRAENSDLNSLITTAVAAAERLCIAIACSSNGELWQFTCSPTGVKSNQVQLNISSSSVSEGYPRSLIWRFSQGLARESCWEFLMLTDCDIHCFTIEPYPDLTVSEVWQHEIVGTDGDSGIKKDIASQKQIWPLDLQVDDQGKVITVLVATICMDRASSSSYTQYSLLTLQHKSEMRFADGREEKVLEKQGPIQVIIPKARVEDKDFLFSMRLRVGGRPPGSAIILSGDGTATVCYCHGSSTRLYKFDLPYDAGKVLDASVLSSTDEHEYGAWTVLTEKAGVWAIPEKAVVLGGVEPPERSLSRKNSSNERSTRDETRVTPYGVDRTAGRENSDIQNIEDKGNPKMGFTRQTARDEESEALLGQLFEGFLLSGKVDGSLEKLSQSGAFDRDGEANVFARKSKSIVDTLAKHWTTTRGAEIVAMTVISSQLVEKQQKHENFLHFLALSKCHEELCSKQRHSLQIILENGEKLAAMIQLRELQNMINQNRSARFGSPQAGSEDQVSCALWDLIQFVGERARRNTVLLMDRDNAEVFYSKVSELEEVFYCLNRQLEYIIRADQPLGTQLQRACELSNACVTILQTALDYKNEHQMWYPPLEGLIPWHSQTVVCNGLWCIASFMLHLLTEASRIDISAKSDIYTHLEVLTEVLLEACAGSTFAKLEREEENKGLLNEYWTRRDTIFDSLYRQAKEFMEAEIQHEGVGPQGGFSYFVFQQLYDMKQFSKLLRLGEEFQDELLIFLKRHSDLVWLHQVFLHQFSSASDTLHTLALSQDEESMTTVEERTGPEPEDVQPTFADRKRFLNLSKIAYVADKDADSESKVKRIEADLNLLKLQEEITKALPNGEARNRLFRPEELIETCLNIQGRWTAIKAFEVFAWTSSSFRENHRSLLEECWRNAADQDDWDRHHQASTNEGWSEEETLQNLRNTALFQASKRCYGPTRVNTFDGDFAQVLPLRRENPEDSTSSVEDVLMSHKDFAEAGKLMLTAIMLGCVEEEGIVAEEFSSPME